MKAEITPTGVKFTIKLAPITKKNHQEIWTNRRTGKPFITQSKQYKQYESNAGIFTPSLHIDTPVNVKALFYMSTHRRVDLVNLQECLLDVLTKYGCIADDNSNIVVSMDGSRVLYDKVYPRTEVFISEVTENEAKD